MRGVLRALVVLQVLLPLCAFAADEKVLVELNSVESADNRCRLNFVVENKSRVAIESMKLDLVGFGTDGGIVRRLITEMGPVRAAKTVVRAFIVDIDCHQLGAVLVNDVAACAASPAPASTGSACRRGSRRCGFTNSPTGAHEGRRAPPASPADDQVGQSRSIQACRNRRTEASGSCAPVIRNLMNLPFQPPTHR
jgi:hypothetical protein